MNINKKGQTLVEVSIVFGIASIVIVSLVILASSALRQAQESVRRVTASKLANAGIESVVFYKNLHGFGLNSVAFPQTEGTTNCVKMSLNATGSTSLVDASPSCDDTVITPDNLSYIRRIEILKTGNIYQVVVTVSWQTGSNTIDSINLSRIITNYDF